LIEAADLLERIWERDPTVWTGHDEAQWLGWLDEPLRMLERLEELGELPAEYTYERVVVAGMGGSSLAPHAIGRIFGVPLDVLDTTHPAAIRRLDLEGVLFVVSSKSGTTVETLAHFEYLWQRLGKRSERFLVITDPGSPLERLAQARNVRVCAGEPTIGGRYSALSVFGIVPALLAGVDVRRLLERAEEMLHACRVAERNPGLELGMALGTAWEEGRDKVVSEPGGLGMWLEQLLAESTGKEGKGLVPAPGESPDGPDRQAVAIELDDPDDLGAAFYRFELAAVVACAVLGVNPFDQPDVGDAEVVKGSDPFTVEELLDTAQPPDYVGIQAFIDPIREPELEPLIARARETGCVVTVGLGPRYLHSTGQLHKGGPPTGIFIQVVDDPGDELPIPGRKFGFRRLVEAQAAGDYAALVDRGRRIARVRLEDIA
jgi:transaldolase/glucose-6-phosphate isomerase